MSIFEQVDVLVEKADELMEAVADLELRLENKRKDCNVLHRLLDSVAAASQSQILDLQHELAAAMDQQMHQVARSSWSPTAAAVWDAAARQQLKLKLKAFADRMRYIRVGSCTDRSAAYLALERELESAWRNA